MNDFHILDAHTLIWHLEGNPKLGKAAKKICDSLSKEQLECKMPFSLCRTLRH